MAYTHCYIPREARLGGIYTVIHPWEARLGGIYTVIHTGRLAWVGIYTVIHTGRHPGGVYTTALTLWEAPWWVYDTLSPPLGGTLVGNIHLSPPSGKHPRGVLFPLS